MKRVRTKAKYDFAKFLRPECFWPQPYSVEQAFGVFAWMIETGQPFAQQGRWGANTIEAGLSPGQTSCTGMRTASRILSVENLRERFPLAFFGDYSAAVIAWRKAIGINAYSQKIIAFPHHGFNESGCCEAKLQSGIDELLSSSGRLAVQLNSVHDDAREIEGVELTYCRHDHAWLWSLMYGVDGSRWYYELAEQKQRETFTQSYFRAQAALAKLIEPTKTTHTAATA